MPRPYASKSLSEEKMEKKEFHETKTFISDDGKTVTTVSVSGSSTSSNSTVSSTTISSVTTTVTNGGNTVTTTVKTEQ